MTKKRNQISRRTRNATKKPVIVPKINVAERHAEEIIACQLANNFEEAVYGMYSVKQKKNVVCVHCGYIYKIVDKKSIASHMSSKHLQIMMMFSKILKKR